MLRRVVSKKERKEKGKETQVKKHDDDVQVGKKERKEQRGLRKAKN